MNRQPCIKDLLIRLEQTEGREEASQISHNLMIDAVNSTHLVYNAQEPHRYDAQVLATYRTLLIEQVQDVN